jgi:hypothetical protein
MRGCRVYIGHPDRGFVLFVAHGGGYGHEPGVGDWPEPITWDYNGQLAECKPAWTRVTPPVARAAAREYVQTGSRPGSLVWPQDQ